MPSCCVKSCPNRGGKAGVTFHKVPFKMKEMWYGILNKCGTKNPSIHMAVCSDHFREQDLDRDGFRTILKKGALPCLYLDKPKSASHGKSKINLKQVQSKIVHFVGVGMSTSQKNSLPLNQLLRNKEEGVRKRKISSCPKTKNKSIPKWGVRPQRNLNAELEPAIELKMIETNRRTVLMKEQNEDIVYESNTTNDEIVRSSWFSGNNVKIIDIKSILKS